MAQRRAARWAALIVFLLIVPGSLAACSSSDPAGPLQTLTLEGQPTVEGASLEVHPGEPADFTAFVVNPLKAPVTLLSAAVVPVTGTRPTGQLVHVAIATTVNMIAADSGWPPPRFPIRKLPGARIGHGQGNIIFSFIGRVPGTNYSAAGLKIRYRYQGQVYSVIAWSAAVACVTKIFTRKLHCPFITDQVQAKVARMAGESS
jgi:hypothetical protein